MLECCQRAGMDVSQYLEGSLNVWKIGGRFPLIREGLLKIVENLFHFSAVFLQKIGE